MAKMMIANRLTFTRWLWYWGAAIGVVAPISSLLAVEQPPKAAVEVLESACLDCHQGEEAEAGLDLTELAWRLDDRKVRQHWIRIYDRVKAGEMPPDSQSISSEQRARLPPRSRAPRRRRALASLDEMCAARSSEARPEPSSVGQCRGDSDGQHRVVSPRSRARHRPTNR